MATIPNGGPVALSTIRDAINEAGGHATNDLMSFFSAENIAEGSPRKPIVLAQDFAQDFDSTKPNYSPNFWQDGGRYGWRFDDAKVTGSQSPFLDVYNKYDGDMNGWQRALPTGGSASPYRLGDFLGYVSTAEKLVSGGVNISPAGSIHYIEDNELLLLSIETPSDGGSSVSLPDITAFQGYYFGVICYNAGGVKRWTNSEPIESIGSNVAIYASTLGEGSYLVVPFLCNTPISLAVNDLNIPIGASNVIAYTLPHAQALRLIIMQRTVDGDGISISASVWMYRDSNTNELRFGYQIQAKNESSVQQTFSGGYIYIGYTGDMEDRPQTIYLPDITVNVSSSFYTVASGYETSSFLLYPAVGLTAIIFIDENIPTVEVTVANNVE